MLAVILWALAAAMFALMMIGTANPKLATNKRTGKVPSRLMMFATFGILTALFAVFAGAATMDDNLPPEAAQTKAGPRPVEQPNEQPIGQFKAEQIVEFPKGEPACLTKEALQKYIEYSDEGEATKANALFVGLDDGSAPCLMLPPHSQAKIIGAAYDPRSPELGIIEIVGKGVKASEHGAFAIASPDFVTLVR